MIIVLNCKHGKTILLYQLNHKKYYNIIKGNHLNYNPSFNLKFIIYFRTFCKINSIYGESFLKYK